MAGFYNQRNGAYENQVTVYPSVENSTSNDRSLRSPGPGSGPMYENLPHRCPAHLFTADRFNFSHKELVDSLRKKLDEYACEVRKSRRPNKATGDSPEPHKVQNQTSKNKFFNGGKPSKAEICLKKKL